MFQYKCGQVANQMIKTYQAQIKKPCWLHFGPARYFNPTWRPARMKGGAMRTSRPPHPNPPAERDMLRKQAQAGFGRSFNGERPSPGTAIHGAANEMLRERTLLV